MRPIFLVNFRFFLLVCTSFSCACPANTGNIAKLPAEKSTSVSLSQESFSQPTPKEDDILPLSASSKAESLPAISITDMPIPFNEERKRLTLEYIQEHYDPAAKDILFSPKMIIVHWTGGSSLQGAFSTFSATSISNKRKEVAKGGEVNVSSQFLIDQDGKIFRLMPETLMARHCIGLNRVAIGIENVGGVNGKPLSAAQRKSNATLIRYLHAKYPEITHMIGHLEYRAFEDHPYFEERDPKYRNRKPDPGSEFMKMLRDDLVDLNLSGPPEPQ